MNLCIDIGNSLVKIAIYKSHTQIHKEHFVTLDQNKIEQIISRFPGINKVISCSVKESDDNIEQLLASLFNFYIYFSHSTPVPVNNNYKSGTTLGTDRLAGVVGANNNFPGHNVLVIDAGTAITYDIIDARSNYAGGAISPGITMRFKALHKFTSKLPYIEPNGDANMIGLSTEESIRSGVINGTLFEMDSFINYFSAKYNNLITVLTGGDTIHFDKKLKNTIFADPDLIFTGLNRILNYNADTK